MVTETHPQSRPAKRLSLAGAKPLKLTTLTTLSAVFPRAQSSQSRAKTEAKMGSLGTQYLEKSKTRAPPKTLKNKPTKSWTRSPFWCQKRSTLSRLFGALFKPWAVLGPKWSPSLPREHPGWSQTLFLMIFAGFWNHFWLLFAFPHLSATTVFSVHWFIQKPKAHKRDVKWEPKMSLTAPRSLQKKHNNELREGLRNKLQQNWKLEALDPRKPWFFM